MALYFVRPILSKANYMIRVFVHQLANKRHLRTALLASFLLSLLGFTLYVLINSPA